MTTTKDRAIREAILDCLICSVDNRAIPDYFREAAFIVLTAFRRAFADEIIADAKIGRSEYAAFKRHFNPPYMERLIEDISEILNIENEDEEITRDRIVYRVYTEMVNACRL